MTFLPAQKLADTTAAGPPSILFTAIAIVLAVMSLAFAVTFAAVMINSAELDAEGEHDDDPLNPDWSHLR